MLLRRAATPFLLFLIFFSGIAYAPPPSFENLYNLRLAKDPEQVALALRSFEQRGFTQIGDRRRETRKFQEALQVLSEMPAELRPIGPVWKFTTGVFSKAAGTPARDDFHEISEDPQRFNLEERAKFIAAARKVLFLTFDQMTPEEQVKKFVHSLPDSYIGPKITGGSEATWTFDGLKERIAKNRTLPEFLSDAERAIRLEHQRDGLRRVDPDYVPSQEGLNRGTLDNMRLFLVDQAPFVLQKLRPGSPADFDEAQTELLTEMFRNAMPASDAPHVSSQSVTDRNRAYNLSQKISAAMAGRSYFPPRDADSPPPSSNWCKAKAVDVLKYLRIIKRR